MKNDICKMEFLLDENNEEILLKDGTFQVMMEWERPYMEACIDALQPVGDVLEIGFGCGYSASHIQKYAPKSHTIIEYHPVVAARARKWAECYPAVSIIEDTWQNALSSLGTFDAIFFDDYPLESGKETAEQAGAAAAGSLLIQEGQKTIAQIREKHRFLEDSLPSREDIDAFLSAVTKEINPEFFVRFLSDLHASHKLTDELLRYALDQLEEKKLIAKEEMAKLHQQKAPAIGPRNDRLFQFLGLCMENHMRKYARFSCYLEDPHTKIQDPWFFNAILVNPHVEYREYLMPVAVPKNCSYYKSDQALVITIQKMI